MSEAATVEPATVQSAAGEPAGRHTPRFDGSQVAADVEPPGAVIVEGTEHGLDTGPTQLDTETGSAVGHAGQLGASAAAPLTRAARRELERAAQAAARAERPRAHRALAILGVLVGFAALQVGMWAVVTDQLARVVGWVSLVAGGYVVDRAWRALLVPRSGSLRDGESATATLGDRLRWAAGHIPWVPMAAVAMGWLLARLRGTA